MILSKGLMSLLELGRFHLTKFVHKISANENNLNPSIDVIAKVKGNGSRNEHLNSHVIGLKWNHRRDSFVLNRGVNRSSKHTLRN